MRKSHLKVIFENIIKVTSTIYTMLMRSNCMIIGFNKRVNRHKIDHQREFQTSWSFER